MFRFCTIRLCGAALVGSLGLLGLGCGDAGDRPELGEVEGTVRLDNQPLKQATVIFQPEKGRPSRGETDDAGHYELEYRPGVSGAAVGKHRVEISTYREADPNSDDESRRQPAPERVPAKYNSQTTLEAEVKAGDNEPIDFNLDSQGAIVTPESESPGRDCSCG
jgi:hypothetical protein